MNPLHRHLAAAQVLLTARRDGDALTFYDLTRGWAAPRTRPSCRSPNLRTVAYLIVQELMIATEEAVALWFLHRHWVTRTEAPRNGGANGS